MQTHRPQCFQRWFVASLLAVAGCDNDSLDPQRVDDVAGDGKADNTDANETWEFENAVIHANVDDDDLNGIPDYEDTRVSGDNDVFGMLLSQLEPRFDAGETIYVELTSTDEDALQVYLDGEKLTVGPDGFYFELGADHAQFQDSFAFGLSRAGVDVEVFLEKRASGDVLNSGQFTVSSAPLVFPSNIQPTRRVWVVEGGTENLNNRAMIAAMRDTMGDKLTVLSEDDAPDVWIQDIVQLGISITGGSELVSALASVKALTTDGRATLDAFSSSFLRPGAGVDRGPQIPREEYGGARASHHFFGNLEVSPPTDEAPLGRVYFGGDEDTPFSPTLAEYLRSQRVQDPFQVDTGWLIVGHIDEVSSFIPDPDAPKGFRLLLSNAELGLDILNSLDEDHAIPRYKRGAPISNKRFAEFETVGDIKSNQELLDFNREVQSEHLSKVRETFKRELGLTEADIIDVPALFTSAPLEGEPPRTATALVPGMSNLLVFNADETHLFVPDPQFRDDDDSIDEDPFAQAFIERLADVDVTVQFVDDWVYHVGIGEVHCGTVSEREPLARTEELATQLRSDASD